MRLRCLLLLLAVLLVADAEKSEPEKVDIEAEEFTSKRLNDFGDYFDGVSYPSAPPAQPYGYQPYRQPPQQTQFNRYQVAPLPAPPMNNYGNYQNMGYGQRQNTFFDVIRDTVRRVDDRLSEMPTVPGNVAIQTNNGFLVENEEEAVKRTLRGGVPRRMPASYDFSASVSQGQGFYMSNRGYTYMGYIERQVRQYPIMIYTLVQCVPCQRAKHMLAISYPDIRSHFLEITGNEDWQRQLQVDLHHLTGAVTFPYVFVCGSYIGGSSDLMQLHQTGQLRQMVNACSRKAKL
ncbi:hypothetical protein QR680_007627 [Steinernema hermaphroditum]|uniref:Glutaredoxin domain-containing protein n=1 Tax=Steinernema hermaphroditum TaxID=289476 RepID=A0AA39IG86_9BILA|nr:hypothetical protein QR680_007627 [Steinernema hermaphroditum]